MTASRRSFVVAALAALAGAAPGTLGAAAQDEDAERPTADMLANGRPLAAPGHRLSLLRFSIPPGGTIDAHHHPGASILAMESGELDWTLLAGSVQVWQGDGPGRADRLLDRPGDTLTLRAGDALFYDLDTAHTARNPGPDPATGLSVTLIDTTQPATIPHEATAEP